MVNCKTDIAPSISVVKDAHTTRNHIKVTYNMLYQQVKCNSPWSRVDYYKVFKTSGLQKNYNIRK